MNLLKHALAIGALAILFACGGTDAPTPASSAKGSPSQDAPRFEREFELPDEMIKKFQEAGSECEQREENYATATSLRAADCTMGSGESYVFNVYGSDAQQTEAESYLIEVNPGERFVFGKGWSVMVPFDVDPQRVVDVFGGEVVGG